jgi:hypothetical protein
VLSWQIWLALRAWGLRPSTPRLAGARVLAVSEASRGLRPHTPGPSADADASATLGGGERGVRQTGTPGLFGGEAIWTMRASPAPTPPKPLRLIHAFRRRRGQVTSVRHHPHVQAFGGAKRMSVRRTYPAPRFSWLCEPRPAKVDNHTKPGAWGFCRVANTRPSR